MKARKRIARRNPTASPKIIRELVLQRFDSAAWRGGNTGVMEDERAALPKLAFAVLDEVGDTADAWSDMQTHSIDEVGIMPAYVTRTAFYRRHEAAIFYVVCDFAQELDMEWPDMLKPLDRDGSQIDSMEAFHSRMIGIVIEVAAHAVSDIVGG